MISDAMAAIIGKKYGKHIIPNSNNKTLEGYLGFVCTTVFLQLVIYGYFYTYFGVGIWNIDWIFIMLSGILCGVGELYSGDMDNIVTAIIYISIDYLY